MKINQFLDTGMSNAWCKEGPIDVYCRRSTRCLRETRVTTLSAKHLLDLATFTTRKPGTGKLGSVFDNAELTAKEHGLAGIFVENVLNERLRDWLVRRGYKMNITGEMADLLTPSYFKLID